MSIKRHDFYFTEDSPKKARSYCISDAADEYVKNLTFHLNRLNGFQTDGDTLLEAIKLLANKYGLVPERPGNLNYNSKELNEKINNDKNECDEENTDIDIYGDPLFFLYDTGEDFF